MRSFTVALLFGVLAAATPGSASTVLTFAIGNAPNGSTTDSSATAGSMQWATLTETRDSDFFSRTFSFSTGNFLLASYNTATPSFSIQTQSSTGSPLANIASNTQLLTAVTSLSETVTHTQPGANVNISGTAQLNATFLADLGLTLNSFTISGAFIGGTGLILNSDTITLTSTQNFVTPEPSTMALFSSSMLVLFFVAGKRRWLRK